MSELGPRSALRLVPDTGALGVPSRTHRERSHVRHWIGPANAATVTHLRHSVGEFAAADGLSGVGLSDLRTCVSEAMTNCVVHAFRDGRAVGTISVIADVDDDRFLVTVSDDGMGFRPRSDSPGAGYGLQVMATLSSSVSIRASASGGTELSMTFPLEVA